MSTNAQDIGNELQKRRVPCLVAFVDPFRIVDGQASPDWNVSLDQINTRTWDIATLHEIVGGIDVGLPPPYHMAVCRDGALALPPLPEFQGDQAAVEFFNKCLATILLGGIYCTAVSVDGLDFGSILDWKYVRVNSVARAAANRFHFSLRGQQASAIEAIQLIEPRRIAITDLVEAAKKGRQILETLPSIGGEFLLKGVTGYSRRDWGAALANLWIVVEQLTSHLWKDRVLSEAEISPTLPGRLKMLRDTRTWTIAARHEVLYQLKEFDADLLASLLAARKARNKLSHVGKSPDEEQAMAVLSSVKKLLRVLLPDSEIPFLEMDLRDNVMSNPFLLPETSQVQPEYWMEVKKLPGEAELEKLEGEARKADTVATR